jgi:hypothetical protein
MSSRDAQSSRNMEQVLEYLRQREPDRGEKMFATWNDLRQRLDIVQMLQKDYGAEAAEIKEGTGNLTQKDALHLADLQQRLSNLNKQEQYYLERLSTMEQFALTLESVEVMHERLTEIHQNVVASEADGGENLHVVQPASMWLRLRSWWYRRFPANTWPRDVREHLIRSGLEPMLATATTPEQKEAVSIQLMTGALGLEANQISLKLRNELIAAAFKVLDGVPRVQCVRCKGTIYLHNSATIDGNILCKTCFAAVTSGS